MRGRFLNAFQIQNFPNIYAKGGDYWVVFVDQNPCESARDPKDPSKPDPLNQKAYKGTPTSPPHCTIRLHPQDFSSSPAKTRDLHFRYAVWIEKEHVDDTNAPRSGPPVGNYRTGQFPVERFVIDRLATARSHNGRTLRWWSDRSTSVTRTRSTDHIRPVRTHDFDGVKVRTFVFART